MTGKILSPSDPRVQQYLGKKFNHWTAVRFIKMERGRGQIWEVRCDCGETRIVQLRSVVIGASRSCGCFNMEALVKRSLIHGYARQGNIHPVYQAWASMKSRCRPTHPQSKDYLERGISVSKRWLKFQNFLEDMGATFKPGLTVERIDNDKGYSKSNCTWEPMAVQNLNSRNNHLLTFNGETHPIVVWTRLMGLPRSVISQRLHKLKWSVERAITTPLIPINVKRIGVYDFSRP